MRPQNASIAARDAETLAALTAAHDGDSTVALRRRPLRSLRARDALALGGQAQSPPLTARDALALGGQAQSPRRVRLAA